MRADESRDPRCRDAERAGRQQAAATEEPKARTTADVDIGYIVQLRTCVLCTVPTVLRVSV